MPNKKLLIIDDDEAVFYSFKTFFPESEYELDYAKNGKVGLERVANSSPNVIIADFKMPEMSGLELLKATKILKPEIPVIIVSAYGDTQSRQTFFKEGAFRYVEKPFDIESLIDTINLAAKSPMRETKKNEHSFIGESPQIVAMFDEINKVKDTDVSVLIQGESGTGKDLIAKYIHQAGHRFEGPFISVNCAALPDNLIESELFGYEKGAFTGADFPKKGKFDLAQNGTLFLDEVAELPILLQSKLLHVLQNKQFERIGGVDTVASNARVLSATNKNLSKMIDAGSFREDLFYRLAGFPVQLVPLRERENDILAIAQYLLGKYSEEFNRPIKTLSPCAIAQLNTYHWPGNVREMQNILSRALLLESESLITGEAILRYIPEEKQKQNQAIKIDERRFIAKYSEKELLQIHAEETYNLCSRNKSETAKRLGINYRTLMKRLEGNDTSSLD